jgi:hypothetical protein
MDQPRFCVFCGQAPNKKNKEHVLPKWLIELTGPPKRTVNFGANPLTGKQPRFDWSSFAFPACSSCNEKYSGFEGAAKTVVENLLKRTPITGSEFITLLDWLDKVRIGLWLGYLYLHGNSADISPRFHIESRIGQKDRMAAVYFIDTETKGLGACGAETLCFQLVPSCFSLNVNNIHVLNMSWDYMCAARCGFPFPRQMVIDIDANRMLECSDYTSTHKIKWPISVQPIIKPVMHVYQPVLQVSAEQLVEGQPDGCLKDMLVAGSDRQGLLVRQRDASAELIADLSSPIEFDEVTGIHCRPLKDIIAQTYDLQITSAKAVGYRSSNTEAVAKTRRLIRLACQANARYRNAFAEMKREEL